MSAQGPGRIGPHPHSALPGPDAFPGLCDNCPSHCEKALLYHSDDLLFGQRGRPGGFFRAHPVFGYSRMDHRQRPGTEVPAPLAFFAFRRQHDRSIVAWAAAGLGVLASKGLSSPAADPAHLPGPLVPRGKSGALFMPLVRSGKCRGFGGRAPKRHGSMQKPDEPFFEKVACVTCR